MMAHSNFLPVHRLRLHRDAEGTLLLTLDGQTMTLGPPRRSLPLSDPDRFIILSDSNGAEVGLIRDVTELEPSSRDVLQAALQQVYVIKRITRIVEVEREPLTGQTQWRVEIATDEHDGQRASEAEAQLPAPTAGDQLVNGVAAPAALANNGHNHNGQAAAENHDKSHDSNILDRINLILRHKPSDESERAGGSLTEECTFLINGHEDVQTARYPHIYIVDTEGKRYEILDCEALDLDSRRAAERFF